MRDEWYVARRGQDGNKRYGPVPLQQLRELVGDGRVQPADLVWREGMAKWERADQCESLSLPPTPRREPRDYPPDDRRGYDRAPRGYNDRPYPRRRYPQQQSSNGWIVALVVGGGVAVLCFLTCGGIIGSALLSNSSSSSSYQPYYSTPISDPEPPQWQPDQNQWQPEPPKWQDPPFAPDPNPPIFVPDPNPIFVPDPNPPIFVPNPNP